MQCLSTTNLKNLDLREKVVLKDEARKKLWYLDKRSIQLAAQFRIKADKVIFI